MSKKWKRVKVFISSTFVDMHAERDHLVKVVFPSLREKLEKYHIHLVDIDLRWGVTEDQGKNGRTLGLCLKGINDCRFFIGILGQRYGSEPMNISEDTFREFGWVKKYPEKSVTELEIMHGALNNPKANNRAMFYFRDPEAISNIPEILRREAYAEDRPESIQKLDDLKIRIRKSGFSLMDPYPAIWDNKVYNRPTKSYGKFTGLETFGNRVIDDLWKQIKQELDLPDVPPIPSIVDGLSEEQEYHEQFMEMKLQFFIGRDSILRKLRDYLDSKESKPLVLTGPSGSGKSAILANLCRDLLKEENHHQYLIPHFIGASPSSADLHGTLSRFCQILKKRFNFTPGIPSDTPKLVKLFQSFLLSVPSEHRLILVIDGIDQLNPTDQPQELAWLPEQLNDNVRIILSCIHEPGQQQRIIDRTVEMNLPQIQVTNLRLSEQLRIIRTVPSISAKTLDREQIKLLLFNSSTKNPLYLLIALEELKGFGSFEHLNTRIRLFPHHDPASPQGGDILKAIFCQVLERLEEEFDKDLLKTVSCLLASSRWGLSEQELKELVSDFSNKDDLFIILRQIRTYLFKRGIFIDFFHQGLSRAVTWKYLSDSSARKAFHSILADYFKNKELSQRKIDELPWQLAQAESWGELSKVLADITFFNASWNSNIVETKQYWALLENHSFSISQAYEPILLNPKPSKNDLWNLTIFLFETGHVDEALELTETLIKHYQSENNVTFLSHAYGQRGAIYRQQGKLLDAIEQFKKQEDIGRKTRDLNCIERSIGNQAMILSDLADWPMALKLLNEEEKLCEEKEDYEGLRTCLGNKAVVLYNLGDFDNADKLFAKVERLCRASGDQDELQRCFGNWALIYSAREDYERALELQKQKEKICHNLSDKESLQICLGNQGVIRWNQGRDENDIIKLKMALTLFEEQQKICLQLNDPKSLGACMGNQSNVYADIGDLDKALELVIEEERICRALKDKDGLQRSFGKRGMILKDRGDYSSALDFLKKQEKIIREIGNKKSLQLNLGNQASIYERLGLIDLFYNYTKEAGEICRELNIPGRLAVFLINQAIILFQYQNEPEDALPLIEEACEIIEQYGISKLNQQADQLLFMIRSML